MFAWRPLEDEASYTLILARDSNFTSLYDSITTIDTAATLSLGQGPYYWRVVATNDRGNSTSDYRLIGVDVFTSHYPNLRRAYSIDPAHMFESSGGGYKIFLVSHRPYGIGQILSISSSGGVFSEKIFWENSAFLELANVIQHENGDFTLIGTQIWMIDHYGGTIKFNSNGDLIWETILRAIPQWFSADVHLNHGTIASSDGLIVTGWGNAVLKEGEPKESAMYLASLDSQGKLLKEQFLSRNSAAGLYVHYNGDTTYTVLASWYFENEAALMPAILTVDDSLSVQSVIPISGIGEEIVIVRPLENNQILVVLYRSPTEPLQLLKMDLQGNVVSKVVIALPSNVALFDVQPTASGGFAVTGHISTGLDIPGANIFFGLFDATGNKRWTNQLEMPNTNYSKSVLPLADGGFLIQGSTNAYLIPELREGTELILVKITSNGLNMPPQ